MAVCCASSSPRRDGSPDAHWCAPVCARCQARQGWGECADKSSSDCCSVWVAACVPLGGVLFLHGPTCLVSGPTISVFSLYHERPRQRYCLHSRRDPCAYHPWIHSLPLARHFSSDYSEQVRFAKAEFPASKPATSAARPGQWIQRFRSLLRWGREVVGPRVLRRCWSPLHLPGGVTGGVR